jgi:hypothetical protein
MGCTFQDEARQFLPHLVGVVFHVAEGFYILLEVCRPVFEDEAEAAEHGRAEIGHAGYFFAGPHQVEFRAVHHGHSHVLQLLEHGFLPWPGLDHPGNQIREAAAKGAKMMALMTLNTVCIRAMCWAMVDPPAMTLTRR